MPYAPSPELAQALAKYPTHTEVLTTALRQNATMLSGDKWGEYEQGFLERLNEENAPALPPMNGRFGCFVAGYIHAATALNDTVLPA